MRLWKHPILLAIAILLCCAFALPQSQPLLIPDGTIIEAKLVRGVESTKARVGDAIEAETTWPVRAPSGAVLIPKRSRLLGHVTKAAGPTLGLVFDSVRLPDRSQAVLDATIQGANARLETKDVAAGEICHTAEQTGSYNGPQSPNSPPATFSLTGMCEPYSKPYPIERVSMEHGERNETVFYSTGNSIKLPKHAQVVLLVGSVDEVCRAKGKVTAINGGVRVAPGSGANPMPSGKDIAPALVIANHQVVGCMDSASAWTDTSGYKR